MISENIKNLRNKTGMTQKELAEKLYVTPQAVSRWENGEVEPSIDTISTMAQIFDVTTDEIIGGPAKKPEPETVVKTEYVVAAQKPVLAVCEQCNKPNEISLYITARKLFANTIVAAGGVQVIRPYFANPATRRIKNGRTNKRLQTDYYNANVRFCGAVSLLRLFWESF